MVESQRAGRYSNNGPNGILDYLTAYEFKIETDTLVFDVFERETRLHVWHGQLKGVADEERDPEKLRQALLRLFADFPPAGPSSVDGPG